MKRTWPRLAVYLVFTCFGALLGFHSPRVQADNSAASGSAPDDAQSKQRVANGKRVLMQGKPDVAISLYFDPVIREFDQRFASGGTTVYSAHTMTESIMYLGLASAANDKAKVKAGIVTLDGTWADALQLKAYALIELNRPEEAKATLHRATELAPLFPAPWNELGYIFQQEKNSPAAMDAYQHAADGAELTEGENSSHDGLTRALRGQAFVLTEQGKLDEAEALYNRCLKLNPDDSHAKNELAYIAGLRKQQAATPAPATSVGPTDSASPQPTPQEHP